MKAEYHTKTYCPLIRCIYSVKPPSNNTQYMTLMYNLFSNIQKNRSQKLSMLEKQTKTVLESTSNSA